MKRYILLLSLYVPLSWSNLVQAQQNVGIGTLTPARRLDVQGESGNTSAVVRAQVTYSGASDVPAFEGLSMPAAGRGIGGILTGGYIGLQGIGDGTSNTGGTYGLYGSATGSTAGVRYGVYGTASGGIINHGVSGSVNGGAGNYAVFGYNPNPDGYAGYFSGRGHFFDDLRADQDLYVDNLLGVGTQAPVSKVHVINGTDASLTTNGFIQLGTVASWNLVLDDNEILARNNGAGNDLFIQNDGGNVLMCASELGGVGIGLTAGTSLADGYLLSVDGKIIAEEMRIQNSNSWPDYVFESSYDLMPLDELRQSIAANKHLPNIPSAKVVEQDGILVGDMQVRMMEKIEELTLYILELHEANKKLEAELKEVKAVISRQ